MEEEANWTECCRTDLETLRDVLGLVHQLFNEIKGLNTRAPLQLSSCLFSHYNSASQSAMIDTTVCPTIDAFNSSIVTEDDETMGINNMQGFDNDVRDSPPLDSKMASSPEIHISPFPDDNLDSYSRIASLHAQYIKLSRELLEQVRNENRKDDEANAEQTSLDTLTSVEDLRSRRNQLRKVSYQASYSCSKLTTDSCMLP